MKIQSVQNSNIMNYKNNIFNRNTTQNPTFQGTVNGHYYKDEIVRLAQVYQYKSNWADELRNGKGSIGHAIKNWHNEFNDKMGIGRTIIAITSLGLSEICMDIISGAGAIVNNSNIENKISEIKNCIDDLQYNL